ncbi:hypothetical protein KIN20_019389 [Parelaphostrongylus tenuis]|uniref:Uncharacterized protein n=1 Tax=Parelaphostrongylus tenuis TaxID=148309 RepID=A0AAD5MLA5_PARTN|nr:hypothetical protein KIN20_019389 [Parelaphostrongylus tenuis]
MIFINSRPLDESIHHDRRPSKAPSHHSVHEQPKNVQMNRIVLCLLVLYLLVSIIPVLLYYPLSLVSLFVPCVTLLYSLCNIKSDNRSDHWPCLLVAVVGILVKTTATVIYIIVFPFNDNEKNQSILPLRRQNRANASLNQYRMVFFVILIGLEILVLLIAICLKWHLVAFEKIENDAQKRVGEETVEIRL